MAMAESTDALLELPPELRALVAFLDADERPALICKWDSNGDGEQRGGAESDVRYKNEALLQAGVDEEELENITRTLSVYSKLGKKKLDVDGESKSWEARDIGNGWHAIVGYASRQSNDVPLPDASHSQSDSKPDPINGGRELVVEDDSGKLKRLDWIQYPGPNLSTWQHLILDHNWQTTSLGAIKNWPHQLRSIIVGMVTDSTPRIVYWGPERAFLCNEAFVPLFGIAHPECLGQPLETVLDKDLLNTIRPYIDSAYEGKTEVLDRQPLQLMRDGHLEETYWDSTLTSIIGPDGTCVGVTESFIESTRAVRGERRRLSVMNLGRQIASAASLDELWSNFLHGLEAAVADVPYAIIYSVERNASDSASGSTDSSIFLPERTFCKLEGTVGIMSPYHLPQAFSLADDQPSEEPRVLACTFTQAWRERKPTSLTTSDETLPQFLSLANPERGLGDQVLRALVIPVTSITGKELVGVLVVGLCPRCPFDDEYSLWVSILGDVLHKTAALISLPIEQRRAQKMAEDINGALAQQLRITTLQAERSDAKFSRMAKLAPIGMFVLDPEGRPLYLNDAYRDLVPAGKSIGDLTKLDDWQRLIHPDDLPRVKASWEQVFEEKIPNVVEYRLLNEWRSIDPATGKNIIGDTWVLATSFPEIEPDGRISAVMGWINDISKQKAAEGLLAQRLEEALETKRQSENFIDMTSHEMRNPLSAILQSADSIVTTLESVGLPILHEDMVVPGQHAEDIIDSAQIIILCAQHQKRITDDILTLSKLDASLLVISPDKVQLPQLVEKALRMYEGEIERAGIKTQLVIEPTYEELKVDWVVLDPSRLLQVIINLLTNAVKFTQYSDKREVTIHLGASFQRPTGKHHGVQFIPARHAKSSVTPTPDWGRGEELYIQVAVSDTGKGLSAEEIKVLFQRFAQASPKTYKQYGGSGLGLFISRELCELQGGQVGVSSMEGRTTFTFYVKARRWMPETPATKPPLSRYVSASSGPMVFTRQDSAPLGQSNGMNTPRAIDNSDPFQDGALQDFGGNRHLSPAKTDKPPAPPDEQLHVLIVEDNLINQKVMSQQLRRAGLTVHVANHGVECLDFVAKSDFCKPPLKPEEASAAPLTPLTIVLLDLEMPTMDGLTCIRHIRERQVKGDILHHLPVIAVTANARSEQINSAIEAGMDQVVTKPFRIPELVPQMRSLIAEVRARQPA